MTTKVCKECGIEKPLNAFWKSRRGKLGRYATCAACLNTRRQTSDRLHQPTITKNWPKKANGLYKMYWELEE